jgi:hypothetical protein
MLLLKGFERLWRSRRACKEVVNAEWDACLYDSRFFKVGFPSAVEHSNYIAASTLIAGVQVYIHIPQ